MTFTEVKELPNKRKAQKKLRHVFEDFMSLHIKIARVDLNEQDYKSPRVAQGCLSKAARYLAFPVDVKLRNGEVYFIRRDM